MRQERIARATLAARRPRVSRCELEPLAYAAPGRDDADAEELLERIEALLSSHA